MTVLAEDWLRRARRLAEQLVAAGKLTSAAWRNAVCSVPRHEFVPEVFRQDRLDQYDPTWRQLDTTTDQGHKEWLDQVYSNAALITAVDRTTQSPSLLSTSSMPALMTRMLETLDVHNGHRVLEIGTGTGYNAGLLSHRLGDGNVFSVDIEPDLVELARQRLARLGYHPTLLATDGATGLPQHAPFDRIIATCSVPAVPWPWVTQTRPGGVILTDVKISLMAGSLVRLTRYPDRAEGPFDPTYAAFMSLRHHPAGQRATRSGPRRQRDSEPEQRTTTLDPRTPWTSLIVWFLASFQLGAHLTLGYSDFKDGQPTATSITIGDGSWAEVSLADERGVHQVTEGGPRRVWRIIENAHALWTDLGQPNWNRFGLTVTENHQQVWLDTPTSAHIWPLPPAPASDAP
ncbi:MAG: ATP-grasp peptide maturase system methyltransferase [Pseudonocardiales bacterium]